MIRSGAKAPKAKLAEFLPYAGVADDGIVVTKNAQLLAVFLLEPHDLGFASEHKQLEVLRNQSSVLKLLSEWGRVTLWADAIRLSVALPPKRVRGGAPRLVRVIEDERRRIEPVYRTDFFLTVVHDTAETKRSMTQLLFGGRTDRHARDRLLYQLEEFKEELRAALALLRSTYKHADLLDTEGLLSYLHAAMTPWNAQSVRAGETLFYLDHYLADGTVHFDTVVQYDDHYILTAGIRDFPSSTRAGMASRILSLDAECRLTTRCEFLAKEAAKKQVADLRRFAFQKRKGLGAMATEALTKQPASLEDTEALSLASDASAAMAEFARGDVTFVRTTTSVQVWDRSYERGMERLEGVLRAVGEEGFLAKRETWNAPSAFLGSLPGNTRFNQRKHFLSTRNLAHLFLLSSPWIGYPENSYMKGVSGEGTPFLIAKTINSAFFFDHMQQDVGHTLVLGPTGAGKSFLDVMMAVSHLKYPKARVWYFDKDRSSKYACERCGGKFVEVRRDEGTLRMNPFARADHGAEEQKFLTDLVVNYLKAVGYPLEPESASKVHSAVVSVGQSAAEHRGWRLFATVVQEPAMREALRPFLPGGHYAELFRDGADEITDAPWVTFEMGELMRTPGDAIVPLICHYLFHRIEERFSPDRPTLLIVDEAWAFLDSPEFAEIMRNLLKTARKKSASVVLSTQEVADVSSSVVFHTIATNCPTKVLLPNSLAMQSGTAGVYRELGLTDKELAVIAGATPKRDYLYVSPAGSQIFRLDASVREVELLTAAELSPEAMKLLGEDNAAWGGEERTA